MPINLACLAYASNHNGKGDLNCLAHTLVAHIKAKKLTSEVLALLRGAYNSRPRRDFNPLDEDSFLGKINRLTPADVEKEITPLLETLVSKDPKKSRFNRFIELANYLGLKVEIYGAEFTEEDSEVPKEYADFIPSKNAELTAVKELGEGIEDPEALADVAFYWEKGVEQDRFDDKAPKVRLFLKASKGGGCDYYFEYPYIEGLSEDDRDIAFIRMFDEDREEADKRVAERVAEKDQLNKHNKAIQQESEKVKKAMRDRDQPLSFNQSISALVGMLGAIFTKLFETVMGFSSKFQGIFGGPKPAAAAPTSPAVAAPTSPAVAAPTSPAVDKEPPSAASLGASSKPRSPSPVIFSSEHSLHTGSSLRETATGERMATPSDSSDFSASP